MTARTDAAIALVCFISLSFASVPSTPATYKLFASADALSSADIDESVTDKLASLSIFKAVKDVTAGGMSGFLPQQNSAPSVNLSSYFPNMEAGSILSESELLSLLKPSNRSAFEGLSRNTTAVATAINQRVQDAIAVALELLSRSPKSAVSLIGSNNINKPRIGGKLEHNISAITSKLSSAINTDGGVSAPIVQLLFFLTKRGGAMLTDVRTLNNIIRFSEINDLFDNEVTNGIANTAKNEILAGLQVSDDPDSNPISGDSRPLEKIISRIGASALQDSAVSPLSSIQLTGPFVDGLINATASFANTAFIERLLNATASVSDAKFIDRLISARASFTNTTFIDRLKNATARVTSTSLTEMLMDTTTFVSNASIVDKLFNAAASLANSTFIGRIFNAAASVANPSNFVVMPDFLFLIPVDKMLGSNSSIITNGNLLNVFNTLTSGISDFFNVSAIADLIPTQQETIMAELLARLPNVRTNSIQKPKDLLNSIWEILTVSNSELILNQRRLSHVFSSDSTVGNNSFLESLMANSTLGDSLLSSIKKFVHVTDFQTLLEMGSDAELVNSIGNSNSALSSAIDISKKIKTSRKILSDKSMSSAEYFGLLAEELDILSALLSELSVPNDVILTGGGSVMNVKDVGEYVALINEAMTSPQLSVLEASALLKDLEDTLKNFIRYMSSDSASPLAEEAESGVLELDVLKLTSLQSLRYSIGEAIYASRQPSQSSSESEESQAKPGHIRVEKAAHISSAKPVQISPALPTTKHARQSVISATTKEAPNGPKQASYKESIGDAYEKSSQAPPELPTQVPAEFQSKVSAQLPFKESEVVTSDVTAGPQSEDFPHRTTQNLGQASSGKLTELLSAQSETVQPPSPEQFPSVQPTEKPPQENVQATSKTPTESPSEKPKVVRFERHSYVSSKNSSRTSKNRSEAPSVEPTLKPSQKAELEQANQKPSQNASSVEPTQQPSQKVASKEAAGNPSQKASPVKHTSIPSEDSSVERSEAPSQSSTKERSKKPPQKAAQVHTKKLDQPSTANANVEPSDVTPSQEHGQAPSITSFEEQNEKPKVAQKSEAPSQTLSKDATVDLSAEDSSKMHRI